MKSYTTLKQSKKLAEILPPDSCDMWWREVSYDFYKLEAEIPKGWYDIPPKGIPCWSLAALIDILPSEFKYYEIPYKIDIRKYTLDNNIDIYQIAYGNYRWYEDGTHSWSDMINTGEKENLIDAAFDMVCWLKENNKI